MEKCDPLTLLVALNEAGSDVTPALSLQISRVARDVVDPCMRVQGISASVAGCSPIGFCKSSPQSIPLGTRSLNQIK